MGDLGVRPISIVRKLDQQDAQPTTASASNIRMTQITDLNQPNTSLELIVPGGPDCHSVRADSKHQ